MNFFYLAVGFSVLGIAAHLLRATAIAQYTARGLTLDRATQVHAYVSLALFLLSFVCMGIYILASTV